MKKRIILIVVLVAIIASANILFFTIRNNNIFEKNAKISDIKKEKGKVNVYLFWGDGCAHCKKAFDFFEDISNRYGSKFNLYGFESWFNDENNELKNKFAKALNDTPKGVPYIIIGEYSFNGFNDSKKEQKAIIKAILNASKEKKDIYFDDIKD